MYVIGDTEGFCYLNQRAADSHLAEGCWDPESLQPASQGVVEWVGKAGKGGKQDNLAKAEWKKGDN